MDLGQLVRKWALPLCLGLAGCGGGEAVREGNIPSSGISCEGKITGSETSSEGKIAFTSFKDGNYEIYVVDEGGGNLKNITNHSASDTNPSWSPR
jgi:hypothetical protein